MTQLLHDRITTYKDSIQGKVEWEDKDIGWGIKVRLPRYYQRELVHDLMITITGPDGLESQARDCVYTGAIAGLLAGAASAYLGEGMGAVGVAGKAFTDAVATCLATKAAVALGQIQVKLEDHTVWGEWHPV